MEKNQTSVMIINRLTNYVMLFREGEISFAIDGYGYGSIYLQSNVVSAANTLNDLDSRTAKRIPLDIINVERRSNSGTVDYLICEDIKLSRKYPPDNIYYLCDTSRAIRKRNHDINNYLGKKYIKYPTIISQINNLLKMNIQMFINNKDDRKELKNNNLW